jgi:hypothetical protein
VKHPFPIVRWVALAFLAGWMPTYAVTWGSADFLYLCNVAVIMTCLGLWLGSALLLSSQAVAMMVIGTVWCVSLAWSAVTHGHTLIGGTEYMWDPHYPLWVRLLSFDHIAVPAVCLWATRKIGFDRRAWKFQSVVAAVVLTSSHFVAPERNLNFARKELLSYHTWGPGLVHVLFIWTILILLGYWPVYAMLSGIFPAPRGRGTASQPSPSAPHEG